MAHRYHAAAPLQYAARLPVGFLLASHLSVR
jgi:hypothetical protein